MIQHIFGHIWANLPVFKLSIECQPHTKSCPFKYMFAVFWSNYLFFLHWFNKKKIIQQLPLVHKLVCQILLKWVNVSCRVLGLYLMSTLILLMVSRTKSDTGDGYYYTTSHCMYITFTQKQKQNNNSINNNNNKTKQNQQKTQL